MRVRSVHDLQAAVRSRRREQGLTQQQVADTAGVSRKWLVGFERGTTGAQELTLVLRVLAALDLPLSVGEQDEDGSTPDIVDLRAHLAALTALPRAGRAAEPPDPS